LVIVRRMTRAAADFSANFDVAARSCVAKL